MQPIKSLQGESKILLLLYVSVCFGAWEWENSGGFGSFFIWAHCFLNQKAIVAIYSTSLSGLFGAFGSLPPSIPSRRFISEIKQGGVFLKPVTVVTADSFLTEDREQQIMAYHQGIPEVRFLHTYLLS